MLRRFAALIMLAVIPAAVSAEGRSMIVFDASGSMWGQIGGRAKIEIARETLAGVLGSVPDDMALGLMVYGHRSRGNCADIELAIPPAPGSAAAIGAFVGRVNPRGRTPLTEAVRQAAQALRHTEERATVILVTDGLESCEGDPCALAAELEATGVDFTAHVVGFGLTDEEGRQVACLAERTGGLYLAAQDAASLVQALQQTVMAADRDPDPDSAPEPRPEPVALEFNVQATASLSEEGEDINDSALRWDLFPVVNGVAATNPVEGGYRATFRTAAPAGDYLLRLRYGTVRMEMPLTLSVEQLSEPHFVLNAGIVRVTGRRSALGERDNGIRVELSNGEARDGGYGYAEAVLPAGEVRLHGRQGRAEVSRTVMLRPGDVLTEDLIVGTGVVFPTAVYAEAGPAVEVSSIRYDVQSATPRIDGSRDEFGGSYGSSGIDVPVGNYVLVVRLDAVRMTSAPFAVEADTRSEIRVVLNAGVAAISAPGARRIDVFDASPDIAGNRRRLDGAYNERLQITLPAGDYVVLADYDGARARQENLFQVTAGQRVEVMLP
jgi:Ca-activated chloride channel family protein